MAIQPEQEPSPRPKPRWIMPGLIAGLIILAALVAVVLTTRPVATSALAPTSAAPTAVPQGQIAHGGLNPSGPAVEQIELAEARRHLDAGTAVFIDVRSGAEYAAGHITGALTISSKDLEATLKAPPEGAVFIVYGGAERPESGQRGAQIFMEQGYPKVVALAGSFQTWHDAGYPVEP